MRKLLIISLFIFMWPLCSSEANERDFEPGYPAGLIAATGVTAWNAVTYRPSMFSVPHIFSENLGTSNPRDLAMGMKQPLNKEKMFQTEKWQAYEKALNRASSDPAAVERYLLSQRNTYENQVQIENKLIAQSRNIKGEAGEAVMQRIYKQGGWESVSGKYDSTRGFDGLYVQRRNGKIVSVLVAESKAGGSQLNTKTNQGGSSSNMRIFNNLIVKAQQDVAKNVPGSQKRLQTLNEIKQFQQAGGKTRTRLHTVKLTFVTGRPVLQMESYNLVDDGNNPVRKTPIIYSSGPNKGQPKPPLVIPLDGKNKALDGKASALASFEVKVLAAYRKEFRTQLIKHGLTEAQAKSLSNDFTSKLTKGEIKSEGDFNKYIRSQAQKYPNLKANSGYMEFQAATPRLATARIHLKAGAVGALIGGLMTAGFEVAQTGRLSSSTLKSVAVGAGVAGGMTVGTSLAQQHLTTALNRVGQSSIVTRATTTKVGSTVAKTGVKNIAGRLAGGSVLVVASSAFAIHGYATGQLTGVQAATTVGVGVTSAVVGVVVAGKVGAAVGSVGGPLGTAAGVVAGVAVVGVYEGGKYVYHYLWVAPGEEKLREHYLRVQERVSKKWADVLHREGAARLAAGVI